MTALTAKALTAKAPVNARLVAQRARMANPWTRRKGTKRMRSVLPMLQLTDYTLYTLLIAIFYIESTGSNRVQRTE